MAASSISTELLQCSGFVHKAALRTHSLDITCIQQLFTCKAAAGVKTIANTHLDSRLRTRLQDVLDQSEYRSFSEALKQIWQAAPDLHQCCISASIAQVRALIEVHEESALQLEALDRLDQLVADPRQGGLTVGG